MRFLVAKTCDLSQSLTPLLILVIGRFVAPTWYKSQFLTPLLILDVGRLVSAISCEESEFLAVQERNSKSYYHQYTINCLKRWISLFNNNAPLRFSASLAKIALTNNEYLLLQHKNIIKQNNKIMEDYYDEEYPYYNDDEYDMLYDAFDGEEELCRLWELGQLS